MPIKPHWNPNLPLDNDTIVLPVAFVRRVSRLRAAQQHNPNSRQARELAQLVDEDLRVIARVLAEMQIHIEGNSHEN